MIAKFIPPEKEAQYSIDSDLQFLIVHDSERKVRNKWIGVGQNCVPAAEMPAVKQFLEDGSLKIYQGYIHKESGQSVWVFVSGQTLGFLGSRDFDDGRLVRTIDMFGQITTKPWLIRLDDLPPLPRNTGTEHSKVLLAQAADLLSQRPALLQASQESTTSAGLLAAVYRSLDELTEKLGRIEHAPYIQNLRSILENDLGRLQNELQKVPIPIKGQFPNLAGLVDVYCSIRAVRLSSAIETLVTANLKKLDELLDLRGKVLAPTMNLIKILVENPVISSRPEVLALVQQCGIQVIEAAKASLALPSSRGDSRQLNQTIPGPDLRTLDEQRRRFNG